MESVLLYSLEIRLPNDTRERVNIKNKISLGSSDQADIKLDNIGLAPQHCLFRVHNEVLSIHNIGDEVYLKKKELMHDRLYILEKGDKLTINGIPVLIRREKISKDEFETNLNSDEGTDLKELLKSSTTNENKKKTNFFSRLLGKQAKKKSLTIKYLLPHFTLRVFSFLVTLSISYALVYTLIPILDSERMISTHINKFTNLLGPYLEKLPPQAKHYLPIYQNIKLKLWSIFALTFAQDIIFSILLGMSLPFFLLGIRSDESFIKIRIKSFLKSILAIVTTPLIIFDLPNIIGKRSLKEFITSSTLECNRIFFKILSITILFPLIIIISIMSPVIHDLNFFKDEYLVLNSPLKVTRSSKDVKRIPLKSSYLRLNSKSFPIKNITILPIPQKKSSKVLIIDHIKNRSIEIMKLATFDFKSSHSFFTHGNPLLFLFYPNFFKDYFLRPKEKSPPSFLVQDEYKKMIQSSLLVSPYNLHTFILANGPFLNGHIEYKRELVSKLNILPKTEYYLINFANTDYLILKTLAFTNIIPIFSQDVPAIRIKHNKKSISLKNKFISQIFSFAKRKEIKFDKSLKDIDGFKILDLFLVADVNQITNIQYKKILQYYKNIINLIKKSKSDLLKKNTIKSIKFIVKKVKNKDKLNRQAKRFVKRMEKLTL